MKLLNTKEAAEYIGIKDRTLRKWKKDGIGPPCVQVGGSLGTIRYTQESIDKWVIENTQNKEVK